MAILLRSRYLLTSARRPPIEDGAVLIDGGRIAAVGSCRDVSRSRSAPVVVRDYGDAVILPLLANAHCHLDLSDFPAWAAACGEAAEPESFVGWIQRLVRVRRRTGDAAVAAAVRRGIALLVAGGTGAVGDIVSWVPGAGLTAASPLLGRLYFETIGLDEERYLPALQSALAAVDGLSGSLSGGLSPHAPYTVSPAHLQAAVASGLPCAIHCAESPAEVEFVRDGRGPLAETLYAAAGWTVPPGSGRSPVAWLDAHGALTPRTLLIHGVQVDEDDAALIARRGCTVVLCPRSNARLKVGTAPVRLYRRYNVPLALGTDSLASNDSLSLWDEIAFARSLYPDLAATELLALATCNGARALGLDEGAVELKAGGAASLQVVRVDGGGPVLERLCGGGVEVAGVWIEGGEGRQDPAGQ